MSGEKSPMAENLQRLQGGDFSPPRAGRNFLGNTENAGNLYISTSFSGSGVDGSRHFGTERLVNRTLGDGENPGEFVLPPFL